ncbi:DNA repair protein RecO [Pseudolabrys sp. FHR47]|uniref:DNA repair protein RecO n=1 Tax=Pseudolabrys sp. FHR47 TaxID=2562284 RepID=UPI0010BF613B|nr:DNA repair protein RecO [Pseudolabrys sp. FHR47]
MQWTDEGIVIGVRRHGEASAILELMTREHGRHVGMVRGGFGSRMKPVLQPGNSVSATWRARLEDHMGNYTIEPLRQRASNYFAAPHAIYGVSHLAALMRLLPERDPHEGLFNEFQTILDRLEDAAWAAPQVARFEMQLLSELGFGLDLEECAATGATEDLIYVSPKSGRAVSREAGAPYADRMFKLPPFLIDAGVSPNGSDLDDGFKLTGFFLARHVLEPRGMQLADERMHFLAALARAVPKVA